MNRDRLRKHLVAALEQAMKTGHPIRVPPGSELYIKWYLDLARTRSGGMAGPNPITYAEMEAYFRLHRWPVAAHHIDLMVALDQAYLAQARASQDRGQGPGQKGSPVAFDAVFG
jgi:hypothetical protein